MTASQKLVNLNLPLPVENFSEILEFQIVELKVL